MVRFRKAEALFQYAILITVVALGLVTMHTYLRRSIQAKVKNLTDHIISSKQLASLSDPITEESTVNVNFTYGLEKIEGAGGMSRVSTRSSYAQEVEHEGESLDQIDYGRAVPTGVENPEATYASEDGNEVAGEAPEQTDEGRSSGGGF
ncbi:MAG: hypothetical protein KAS05_04070 [Candidatus Omnitrophica bacterium]|nr:hypothetical protein [Candidatus Omnitrophota bacterium]